MKRMITTICNHFGCTRTAVAAPDPQDPDASAKGRTCQSRAAQQHEGEESNQRDRLGDLNTKLTGLRPVIHRSYMQQIPLGLRVFVSLDGTFLRHLPQRDNRGQERG